MKFNSSNRIDDDYYQSDDHSPLLDEAAKTIRMQNYRVRYGLGDDYRTLMDNEFSLVEFGQRKDLQDLVNTWFGDLILQAILDNIIELA